MPHGGGTVSACQQTDPNVIDFCGSLLQGVYDVLDMFAVKRAGDTEISKLHRLVAVKQFGNFLFSMAAASF